MSYGDYLCLDHLLVGPAAAEHAAAARRAAVHHPAPDLRAVAEADGARAALGARAARGRRPRAGAQAARPGQAHPAHAHRPVVRAGHDDAERVRRRSGRSWPRRPGFQSAQYREVEFLLGNKNADMVNVFAPRPGRPGRAATRCCTSRASTTSTCAYLARGGYAVPAGRCCRRDWSQPYRMHPGLVDTIAAVYAAPERALGRVRDLRGAGRRRGQLPGRGGSATSRSCSARSATRLGTGGSSGVDFLRRALDLTFFPELYEVRTRIGS